jgi:hypothetical protein
LWLLYGLCLHDLFWQQLLALYSCNANVSVKPDWSHMKSAKPLSMFQLSQPAVRTMAWLPAGVGSKDRAKGLAQHSRRSARFNLEKERSSALWPRRTQVSRRLRGPGVGTLSSLLMHAGLARCMLLQGICLFTSRPDNKPMSSDSVDSVSSYETGVQGSEVKRYQEQVSVVTGDNIVIQGVSSAAV